MFYLDIPFVLFKLLVWDKLCQILCLQREWAEAKKELQEERENVRTLTLNREQTIKNSMRQVEEMGKDLANALHAVTAAETRAAVAEVLPYYYFSLDSYYTNVSTYIYKHKFVFWDIYLTF